MAMTLELIGGSSYLWRWKHGIFHHTYVNVAGHDTDIDLALSRGWRRTKGGARFIAGNTCICGRSMGC
jgi:fatty acid desaturase